MQTFLELVHRHRVFLSTLGGKLIFTALVVLAGRIAISVTKRIILRSSSIGKLKVDEALAGLFQKLVSYTIIIIATIIILDAFGVNTTSLIAVLGAAGVAIGLALKDTLSNIASGIILLVLRFYHKGDYIEFGSCMGTVKEINLFTTILETSDGIYIAAPNSKIWNVPLKNYTRNQRRRMDLTVGISYDDSLDVAFRTLREIAAAEPRFLPDPAPQVMVQSLADSSVVLMLRAWTSASNYWSVYWDQTRNLKEKLEEAGISIPFPQRDIHIISSDAPK